MIPNDPVMLLSFINTKLRDEFDSFEELCNDLNESSDIISEKLASIDYYYDQKLNKFV